MASLDKRLSLREKADLIDGARYFDLDSQHVKGLLRSMADPHSRETLVAMSPDDFLTLAAPIQDGPGAVEDSETGRLYAPSKMEGVIDALERGVLLADIPFLNIDPVNDDEEAKVKGHEGRHRAMALEKIGVRLMPVRIKSDTYRWGMGRPEDAPYRLIQEDGWEWCDCSVSGRSERPLSRTETVAMPQSLAFPSGGERKLLASLFMYASPRDRPDDYDADLVTDIVVYDMDPDAVSDEPDEPDEPAEFATVDDIVGDLLRRRVNGTSAKRDDPELWEEVKAEVTRGTKGGKRGQWSARKAQMAVRLYKERGGGYIGPRDPDNSLTQWTEQDWRTKSGRPSLETGERYLPAAAIEDLSPAEYAATTRAKRAGMKRGQQFVAQPKRIARKTAKHRKKR